MIAQHALEWLAQHENYELSHTYNFDDYEPDEWQVHSVNGGRNDREWALIGRGETPLEALQNAKMASQ